MDLIQVLFLSFIQGLTEFLPISSSAHLILFSDFFNSNIQSLNFDISLHLGTLIAACVYFKDEILQILNSFSSSDNASIGKKLLVNLTIATLPILIIGFFVRDLVEIFLRSPEIIAYTTIIFAVILYLSTKVKTQYTQLDSIFPIQSLIIGLAQCLALIPGTSRSGVTISAGLALGMDSKVASRFSFLLAIPTIGAIASYQIIGVDFTSFAEEYKANLMGIFISFVTAYLTIDFFIKFIDRIGFMPFIIYRLALGTLILVFLF
tara:strand:+ start:246 stop:1034 length:789 start_codon:yes stop_codon:yes gene_type:complete